jgi:aldose 1-epimerase
LWAVNALSCLLLLSCKNNTETGKAQQNTSENMPQNIQIENFGPVSDGQFADLYHLKNKNGVEASITNYGGIVVSLKVPDRNGLFEDVVLGYDSLSLYVKDSPYFGSLVGRYGNRIANGSFNIDGKSFNLAKNNGANHLHGGLKGFDKVIWNAEPLEVPGGVGLRLMYHSPDGEEGYPGNLSAQVDYILTDNNELQIEYTATTDKKTHVNLTHHSYFNLCGNSKRDILDHELMIAADGFLPVDEGLIPTGKIKPVEGTAFDFRFAKPIGLEINESDEQLKNGQGYDHNWVLNAKPSIKTETIRNIEMKLAATVRDPESGRYMELLTTEPGLQFYSGNFLDGDYRGKYGVVYQDRYGFCLETQHYPDSPNQPAFPSTLLEPSQTYRSLTVYRFSVKD